MVPQRYCPSIDAVCPSQLPLAELVLLKERVGIGIGIGSGIQIGIGIGIQIGIGILHLRRIVVGPIVVDAMAATIAIVIVILHAGTG